MPATPFLKTLKYDYIVLVRIATHILAGRVTHGLIATNERSAARPSVDSVTADRNTDGRCPNQFFSILQTGSVCDPERRADLKSR
jgi:hypothetical protein